MTIGVLDIQGSVEEHLAVLRKIGAEAIAVKTKMDLDRVNGLIIPGGESTTIGKLLKRYGLDKEIRKRALYPLFSPHHTLALWGTCAGAILLAKKITNGGSNRQPPNLGLMDIEIERNFYGRQMDSFETKISVSALGRKKIPAIFIRAPRIKRASRSVKIMAQYDGTPVMVRQYNLLATMFHPELTNDTRVHKYFISLVNHYANRTSS